MSSEIHTPIDQVGEKQIRDRAVDDNLLKKLVSSLYTPEGNPFFSEETQATFSSFPSEHHDNSLSVLVSQMQKGKESYTGYIRGGITPEGNILIDTIVIDPKKPYTLSATAEVIKKAFAPGEKDHVVILAGSAKETFQQMPQIAEKLGLELIGMDVADGKLSCFVKGKGMGMNTLTDQESRVPEKATIQVQFGGEHVGNWIVRLLRRRVVPAHVHKLS